MTTRNDSDLRAHQRFMLDFLIKNRRVAWYAQPGVGKTAPGLTAVARFLDKNPEGRVLIGSFKGVVHNVFEREAQKWEHLKHLKFYRLWEPAGQAACLANAPGIYLANWERLNFIVDNASKMRGFGFVYFDESSALKHRTSRRAKHAMAIAARAAFCITADGSPRSGGIFELWAQLQITRPRCVGSYAEFEAEYCFVDDNGRVRDKPGAADALAKKLADIAVVFRAADVVDVPEEVATERFINLSPKVNEQIEELSAMLATFIEGEGVVKTKDAIAVVSKIEQLISGRALSGMPEDIDRKVLVVHDEKLDCLERLVAELNGEPLLVAAKFKGITQAVIDRIPGAVVATTETIGGIMPVWRDGRIPLLIANPRSLGHGIDGLQDGGARHICFLTQEWSGSARQQFIARLKRSGQKQAVYVHDILAAGETVTRDAGAEYYKQSLDEIINDRVRGKIFEEAGMLEFMAKAVKSQMIGVKK